MSEISAFMLAMVADKLDRLGLNYAFLGGAVVAFLLDHRELSPVRATDDLDIILEAQTIHRYSDTEARLRSVGFIHDTRQGAPLCRWTLNGVTVDIMPTEGGFMGLKTAWFSEALKSAIPRRIGRFTLKIVSPVAFVATKLAAFADRGRGDYFGSHDLEDLLTVVDGRAAIVQEIATSVPGLRSYIVSSIQQLVQSSGFQEALPGFLPSDSASQQRLPGLRDTLQAISEIHS